MVLDKKHFSEYDFTKPKGVTRHRKNMWVWCNYGDETRGIIFQKYSIQGNPSFEACKILKPQYEGNENLSLVFLEDVYIPYEEY